MSLVNSKLSGVSKSDSVTFKPVPIFLKTASSTCFSFLFPTAGLDDNFAEWTVNGILQDHIVYYSIVILLILLGSFPQIYLQYHLFPCLLLLQVPDLILTYVYIVNKDFHLGPQKFLDCTKTKLYLS